MIQFQLNLTPDLNQTVITIIGNIGKEKKTKILILQTVLASKTIQAMLLIYGS